MEIRTEIEIDASSEKVWQVLTDFASFGEWNSFIPNITGNLGKGESLIVQINLPEGKKMTFKPIVIEFKENEKFGWRGDWIVPWIFQGEHLFELTESASGTSFVHREKFKGILLPFLKNNLEIKTKAGFELMNQQLKKRVEQNRDE